MDFEDIIGFVVVVLLVLGIPFVALVLIGNEAERNACANYQKTTGKETRFFNFDQCYIKTEDGFQRWDEYKVRAAASEGLKAKK